MILNVLFYFIVCNYCKSVKVVLLLLTRTNHGTTSTLAQRRVQRLLRLLLRPFPYLESAHRVFNLHVLWSCASSLCTPFSISRLVLLLSVLLSLFQVLCFFSLNSCLYLWSCASSLCTPVSISGLVLLLSVLLSLSLVLCFFSLYSCLYLWSCASSLCTPVSISGLVLLLSVLLSLFQVFSYNITPPQFWSSYLSVSTHFHLPFYHCYIFFSPSLHLSLASLIFSLMFATPAVALKHSMQHDVHISTMLVAQRRSLAASSMIQTTCAPPNIPASLHSSIDIIATDRNTHNEKGANKGSIELTVWN